MARPVLKLLLLLVLVLGASPLASADDASSGDSSLPSAPSAMLSAAPGTPMTPAVEPIWPSPLVARPPEAPRRKTFDRNFALVSLLAAGLMVADLELTQHCQDNRTCIEMNPLMPRSRGAKYASVGSFNAMLFFWSFRRKESGKKLWWLAPLLVIGAHGGGAANNLRFVR
jgi:hypothetical protein